MIRPQSSSRGRNTSASVTVTVTPYSNQFVSELRFSQPPTVRQSMVTSSLKFELQLGEVDTKFSVDVFAGQLQTPTHNQPSQLSIITRFFNSSNFPVISGLPKFQWCNPGVPNWGKISACQGKFPCGGKFKGDSGPVNLAPTSDC